MSDGLKIWLWLAIAAALGALSASGQSGAKTCGSMKAGLCFLVPGPKTVPVPAHALGQLMKVIDDPSLGDRWLLTRDPDHPGGPGRLLLSSDSQSGARQNRMAGVPGADSARTDLVIHAGDRLVVEENTAVAEARLEAVALGPAWAGSSLNVRLKIGGKVVRAVALAPGRAAFEPETEVLR